MKITVKDAKRIAKILKPHDRKLAKKFQQYAESKEKGEGPNEVRES